MVQCYRKHHPLFCLLLPTTLRDVIHFVLKKLTSVKSLVKPCGLTSRDLYEDGNWSTSKELALHVIKSVCLLDHSNPLNIITVVRGDVNSKQQAVTSHLCRWGVYPPSVVSYHATSNARPRLVLLLASTKPLWRSLRSAVVWKAVFKTTSELRCSEIIFVVCLVL